MWLLFYTVDSIIDSLLIFLLLSLVPLSYFFYYLHLSVSFYYLGVLFMFGVLGDMLMRTLPIVCPCLRVEIQCLFFFRSCLFVCVLITSTIFIYQFHFITLSCCCFMFGALGDMLMNTRPIECPCLRVETQCLFLFRSCIFMCIVSRLDLCGGYSTLLIA